MVSWLKWLVRKTWKKWMADLRAYAAKAVRMPTRKQITSRKWCSLIWAVRQMKNRFSSSLNFIEWVISNGETYSRITRTVPSYPSFTMPEGFASLGSSCR